MKWLNFFDGEPCTGFPNTWLQWQKPKLKRFWRVWRVIDISNCCAKHDEECSTKVFWKCMRTKKAVGSLPIVLVASTVCLFKYKKV